MRIGYDIDNTTGDYEGALRDFHGKKMGVPEDELMKVFPPSPYYDMSKSGWPGIDTREQFMQIHADAVDAGIFETMGIYKEAHNVMWRLHNAGHDSIIITARYLRRGDHHTVNETTSRWLDHHDLPVDELHVTGEKVHVYADVYVDDSPHNIEVLRAAERTVIIYDQVYNRHMDGLRVHNWKELEDLINEMAVAS